MQVTGRVPRTGRPLALNVYGVHLRTSTQSLLVQAIQPSVGYDLTDAVVEASRMQTNLVLASEGSMC